VPRKYIGLKKVLFSFSKKLNKNKGLILGLVSKLAPHLPFAGIIQIRFNGYDLSLTAPLRDDAKLIQM
jgi:hypothetical protein